MHRRSKSILKKSDSGGNKNTDPESERLISDNTSGFEMGFECDSPNKRFSSPVLRQRTLSQKTLSKQVPAYQQELERTKTLKSQLFLLDDIICKEKQTCKESVIDSNKLQCSDNISEVPLYICPPPPPMDNSPTEETRLLFHSTVLKPQSSNSIPRGRHPSS